jgi:hypothetical protein
MKFKGLQEAGNYKVGVGTIAGGNGLFLLETSYEKSSLN